MQHFIRTLKAVGASGSLKGAGQSGVGMAMLLFWLGCAGASNQPGEDGARVEAMVGESEVLLVHDTSDPYGEEVYRQVRQTLRYTKTHFEEVDLAAGSALPALAGYQAVLTTTEKIDELRDAAVQRLEQYVAAGGGLAVLFRGWHDGLRNVFGVPGEQVPRFRAAGPRERLVLRAALMPGDSALVLPPLELSAYDIRPGADAQVLLEADSSGLPLAWQHRYEAGRVVYWNTGILSAKGYRGFIAQSLALVQPRTVRAMANWAAFYLDDFPSPASSQQLDPIKSEYGQTAVDFYARQWYPDMRALAEEFGVPYTSTVIFSYNGDTAPPFRFSEWVSARIMRRGRRVPYAPWVSRLDAEVSEMALHGYNHQSLTRELWSGQEAMTQALQASRRRWQVDHIGPLPTTYVPPMNVIDSVGMRAISEAYPSVEVVAGYYTGAFAYGQNREFGPEPWNENLYALPRNTSGYIFTEPMRMEMLSLLQAAGVWGHFLHPDEVYPNEDRYESLRAQGITPPPTGFLWRNEPKKDGLYYRFRHWLTFAKEHYPWLRYMKAAEAAEAMKRYQRLDVGWKSEGSRLTIRTTGTPVFFSVYTTQNEHLEVVQGGERLHAYQLDFFRVYVIKATQAETTLTFAPNRGPV